MFADNSYPRFRGRSLRRAGGGAGGKSGGGYEKILMDREWSSTPYKLPSKKYNLSYEIGLLEWASKNYRAILSGP